MLGRSSSDLDPCGAFPPQRLSTLPGALAALARPHVEVRCGFGCVGEGARSRRACARAGVIGVVTSFLSVKDVAALGVVHRGSAESIWNSAPGRLRRRRARPSSLTSHVAECGGNGRRRASLAHAAGVSSGVGSACRSREGGRWIAWERSPSLREGAVGGRSLRLAVQSGTLQERRGSRRRCPFQAPSAERPALSAFRAKDWRVERLRASRSAFVDPGDGVFGRLLGHHRFCQVRVAAISVPRCLGAAHSTGSLESFS